VPKIPLPGGSIVLDDGFAGPKTLTNQCTQTAPSLIPHSECHEGGEVNLLEISDAFISTKTPLPDGSIVLGGRLARPN
jgi:hypothetical protein